MIFSVQYGYKLPKLFTEGIPEPGGDKDKSERAIELQKALKQAPYQISGEVDLPKPVPLPHGTLHLSGGACRGRLWRSVLHSVALGDAGSCLPLFGHFGEQVRNRTLI